VRVFVADAEWTELSAGELPAVRFSASDLQQAQRLRRRLTGAAVLDVTVVVEDDFRSAQRRLAELDAIDPRTLVYAGTLDGLAGLIADIYVAGVADGVTLIPAAPQQDARSLGEAALARVAARLQAAA
jgi:hypothetical protein